MHGLITLDFGNSHPHAGLFQKGQDGWQLIKVSAWQETAEELVRYGITPGNSAMVLCEVKAREEDLVPYLEKGFLLTRVRDHWRGDRFFGMPVNYAKTLGEDRLILAHHCYKKDKRTTLIIDAGTFTTIDLVSRNGFEGGYIIPGVDTYFSTFSRGEQLKETRIITEVSPELPKTTLSAMALGYGAFAALAKELVTKHSVQRILLTGGHSTYWKELLGSLDSVEIQDDPHALHWALQHWFTTQIELL